METLCILNHMTVTAGADGWAHVCPLGEHVWRSSDGKETIVQVIDAEACRLMAQSYPLSDQDSMWDWEHDSMTARNRTAAAGWGKEAQVRADGLWVRVEWTPEGLQDVQGKKYKFNSPCFPREGAVLLEGNRHRITKLGRIALTNNPNLQGQKPLTNSRDNPAIPNPTNKPKDMDFKALLLKILGLPATAADQEIQDACDKAGCSTMPAMNARIAELETSVANSTLDAYGITDPAQRRFFAPLLNSTDKDIAAGAIKALADIKGKAAVTHPPALHNSRGAKVPNTLADLQQGDEETVSTPDTAAAAAIEGRARELQALSNSSRRYTDCFNQAEAEWRAKNPPVAAK